MDATSTVALASAGAAVPANLTVPPGWEGIVGILTVVVLAVLSGVEMFRRFRKGTAILREDNLTIRRMADEKERFKVWADAEIARLQKRIEWEATRADREATRADQFAHERNKAYEEFSDIKSEVAKLRTQLEHSTQRMNELIAQNQHLEGRIEDLLELVGQTNASRRNEV